MPNADPDRQPASPRNGAEALTVGAPAARVARFRRSPRAIRSFQRVAFTGAAQRTRTKRVRL